MTRLVFPLTLLLAACTNPEPDKDAIVRKAQEVSAIHVHSLPPGCFVELNNEFMGVTPVTGFDLRSVFLPQVHDPLYATRSARQTEW